MNKTSRVLAVLLLFLAKISDRNVTKSVKPMESQMCCFFFAYNLV